MAKSDGWYKRTAARIVDAALTAQFAPDPLMPAETSRWVSALGSIQRRHGPELAFLLADSLAEVDGMDVFVEPDVGVTQEALDLAETGDIDACRHARCTPLDGIVRYVRLDVIVLDHRTGRVCALEVKRGTGNVDAGKRRSTIKDGLAALAMMRDFATRHGLADATPDFRVVSIYGRSGFQAGLSVNGDALDLYLDAQVSGEIWRLERALRNEIERRGPTFRNRPKR